MYRIGIAIFFLALIYPAAWSQLSAEEPFPKEGVAISGRVANSFRIAELLFIYRNPLLSDSAALVKQVDDARYNRPPASPRDAVEEVDDVVAVANAICSARPESDVEEMIAQVLENEHDMHLEKATLLNHGDDGWFWHIKWQFFPSTGGFTGTPWAYLGVVSGNGDVIQPEISLWSSFPIQGDHEFVRSHFRPEKLAHVEGRKPLFGDEVSDLATRHLADFSKKHSIRSIGAPSVEVEGKGELLRWRFQTQSTIHLDGQDIWKVEFIDETWGAKEAIDSLGLTLWISSFGEVSELSLGSEEFQ